MEENKTNEEQKNESTSQTKMQFYRQEIIRFVKKQPWILGAVAIVLVAVIIAFATIGNTTTMNKEITAYLNDSSQVPFGELTISSAYERDSYVTKENAFVSVSNGKKVICVCGEIENTTDKNQSLSADMFRLNYSNNNEINAKSYAFLDTYSSYFNSVTIPKNAHCLVYLYYIVDDSVILNNCKLIVYSAVIALRSEPIILE